MKTIDNISLKDTIPDSIGKDEQVKAAIKAIDPKLQGVAISTDASYIYSNIDKLSSLALDHLALQYDVDAWRDSWDIAMKRSVLKTAIMDKRKKGTLSAVREAVSSLGGSATIREWWQSNPKGTPHTFTINVSLPKIDGVLGEQMQDDLIALIDGAKPARSHYSFVLNTSLSGTISAIGFVRTLTVAEVRTREFVSEDYKVEVGMVATSRAIVSRHLTGKGV